MPQAVDLHPSDEDRKLYPVDPSVPTSCQLRGVGLSRLVTLIM